MSSKTLEGMARAHWTTFADVEPKTSAIDPDDIEAMRVALLWLADNVSDEMVHEFTNAAVLARPGIAGEAVRQAISAALRAAGDGR